MSPGYLEHLEPKLKEKINNLKRYLDPDYPRQDERYVARGYKPAQNQARRDVLRVFDRILAQEVEKVEKISLSLAELTSLISSVLTRPEQLTFEPRTIGFFSRLLASTRFEQMKLVEGLIRLSGCSEEQYLKTYYSHSEKAARFEKQLLKLVVLHPEIGDSQEIKVTFESLVRKFRQVCETEDEEILQKCLNLLEEILTSKNSITDKNKQQTLLFKKNAKEFKSLEASIMIFKTILDAHEREEKESLTTTEVLTDEGSDVVPASEDGLSENTSKEEIREQEGTKEVLKPPKGIMLERPQSLASFERAAFQALTPEFLERNKPPMMNAKTLGRCIKILKDLNNLSNKNPELNVPVNNMKELVRLVFVEDSDMACWTFLREHQGLMKIPWEYEREHPELSPCIEDIQDLYQISGKRLTQIKHKLCPEMFLPDRDKQTGIGRDFDVVMGGKLQVLFAYIDNTKNPEEIRNQVKRLATEFQVALRSGSTKEKEQAHDSILNTEKVLNGTMDVDAYQEYAKHVTNYPSRRMQAVGALMFALGAIILTVGLTSIVGVVVGGVVGGSGMAAGLHLFAKAKEQQSLSKIQGDLGDKLKSLKDADHDNDDHEHDMGTNKKP